MTNWKELIISLIKNHWTNRRSAQQREVLANNKIKKFPHSCANAAYAHECRQWGRARYAFECGRLQETFSKDLVGIRRVFELNRPGVTALRSATIRFETRECVTLYTRYY